MRRYQDADTAGLRYLELRVIREDTGGVQSPSLAVMAGEYCIHCGGGPSTWLRGRKGKRLACSTCHRPWQGAPRMERAGIVAIRGDDAAEERMAGLLSEWEALAPVIESCPAGWLSDVLHWPLSREAWLRSLVMPQTSSSSEASVYAWLARTEGTTLSKMRRMIEAAREGVDASLAAAGLRAYAPAISVA